MPKLTIDQERTVNVPAGKRLVNALSDEGAIDQLHACGGNAKCTTCRVLFVGGEPDQMTQAERDVLIERGLAGRIGMRLSCQIACNDDMSVRAISRLTGSGRKDVGPRPVDAIEPPPQWIDRSPSE
jgi:ferredoxin